MTLRTRYNGGMELLSVQSRGFLFVLLLFALCFTVVHGIRFALFGYRALKKKPAPPKKRAAEPEAVYYLVEKKKKRAKAEYSEPKRIHFK